MNLKMFWLSLNNVLNLELGPRQNLDTTLEIVFKNGKKKGKNGDNAKISLFCVPV